jgi:hypothetical protein
MFIYIYILVPRDEACCSLHRPAQVHIDALHDIVLFRIVGMFLGRNFQDRGNSGMILSQDMTNGIGHMLIDENDTDVFPHRQRQKGLFQDALRGVRRHNQEIGGVGGAMANAGQQKARDGILVANDGHQLSDFLWG